LSTRASRRAGVSTVQAGCRSMPCAGELQGDMYGEAEEQVEQPAAQGARRPGPSNRLPCQVGEAGRGCVRGRRKLDGARIAARATKVQSNTKKRRRTHLVEGLAGEEEVAPRQPSWASGRSPGCFGFGRWDRQPPGDRGSGSCEHQGEKMGKGERMTVVSRRSHKARRTVCHAHARWAGHAGSPRRGGGFLFLPFL
jgi:hypothetical protein